MKKSNMFSLGLFLLSFISFHKAGCTLWDPRPKATRTSSEPIDPKAEPLQTNLSLEEVPSIHKKLGDWEISLIPRARYKIAGRVVSRKHYYLDWEAKLMPVDLAMAWGPMSSTDYDSYISYSHSHRYYTYRVTGDAPFEMTEVTINSANEHLIPGSRIIERALKSVSVGEVVEFSGYLVNVEAKEKSGKTARMETSLVRDDGGGGACEIMYVEEVRIGKDVFL